MKENPMPPTLGRRRLLAAAAAATLPLPPLRALADERRFEPAPGDWRSFEVTTTVTVVDPKGGARVWLPVPSLDTEFQRTLSGDWSGNAAGARFVADPDSGVRALYAEFAADAAEPTLRYTARVQTRSRAVDWSRRVTVKEDPALLRSCLAPTRWIPTDGIVRKTALEATKGAHADVEKVRGIYDWLVVNAHREPKVRGCGAGDVKAMLETGDLGGKCADLNAIFVGLCRAVGVPARDLYGVRLARSAFGYRELGADPAKLQGAQHCRAEVYLQAHGWVAMDPADVLKVMRQETPQWIKDPADPIVAPVSKALFGGWEGNWIAYNSGHDVRLPGTASKAPLPFLMYPQGENAAGRFDELSPDTFRYAISAKEIVA
jgi:transglutaminase-like putative cysteine protease